MLRDTGWLWCGFTQHLVKRHNMTQQFNHETLWIYSLCLIHKHSNMLTFILWYPFLLQLTELCTSEVSLILSLCSFLSSPSLNPNDKPTQQITNWCLAWEAVLCHPLAAGVKSPLCAQLGYYDPRCWSQDRSRELLMRYTWDWVRKAEKWASCKEENASSDQPICWLHQKKQLSCLCVLEREGIIPEVIQTKQLSCKSEDR